MTINPLLLKKIKRFRSIKRGYYSLLLMLFLLLASAFAELWVNNRALLVYYEGKYFFPTYTSMNPGTRFGLDYAYETNYRDLQQTFASDGSKNFVVMPIIPFGAFDLDLPEGRYPPYPPSWEMQHYLGSDTLGRDMIARLVYGFRVSIIFAFSLLLMTFSIGIAVGCLMGYIGGKFDLFFQRLIEIWSSIPFLYVVMIVASLITPNLWILVGIAVFFGWMGMTWYMRTMTYKEKARDYVLAAQAIGASNTRIIFHHILPNAVSLIVTFVPFSVAGGISALTALDFLGFGLPPPTPSWGELLQQGTANLQSLWIISSVVAALVVVMVSITFIGEAVREGFDPKMHSSFE